MFDDMIIMRDWVQADGNKRCLLDTETDTTMYCILETI